jgi:hydroxymethylpyrimidine pyrophosphatase-like HAD family hydrolase
MAPVTVKALACDYDGTLASHDRLAPEAVRALEQARAAGLRVVLATGRTFFELTRVCDRLDLFDAVVVENGGVLYFPGPGTVHDQAPPPPPRLLAALDRRQIAYQVGRVVVGTWRAREEAVRQALADTGTALEIVHNRAALMLLPEGVTKGSGLRAAARALGLSPHDVVGVGDAENDLPLFDACGFSACPADAVAAVQARVDWVLPGENGRAVAAFIAGPLLEGRLALHRSPRRRVELGWAPATGERVTLPARGVSVLIGGDPFSGKSRLAGLLVERLVAERYAVWVLDPEGDYRPLAELGEVAWAAVATEAELAEALGPVERGPAASAVLDLSAGDHPRKVALAAAFLRRARALRAGRGLPHWIVVDEAHYLLHPQGVDPAAVEPAAPGLCLVTHRASWLTPALARAFDVLLLARTTTDEELAFLGGWLAECRDGDRIRAVLPHLPPGEFVLVDRVAEGGPQALTFAAAPRRTRHVRHLRKYADASVPLEHRFVLRDAGGRAAGTADSLAALREALAAVPPEVLAHHVGRRDLSRWVADVFGDAALARGLRGVETRWAQGEEMDLRQALVGLIALRYGPAAPAAR